MPKVKRACLDKKWFDSFYELVIWVLKTNQENKFSAYPCEFCDGHHLTSTNPSITSKTLETIGGEYPHSKIHHKKKYRQKKHAEMAAKSLGLIREPRYCSKHKCWHVVFN